MSVATLEDITPDELSLVAGRYGWIKKNIYTHGACAICGGERAYYIGEDKGTKTILSNGGKDCSCNMIESHKRLYDLYSQELHIPPKKRSDPRPEIGNPNGKIAGNLNEVALQKEIDVSSLKPLPLVDLQAMEFEPLVFLVDGLIALGQLVVLGGRPKSGKSWLVLQLAMAIDTGNDFLGRATQKGKVVYLALEDGRRRLHQRSKIIKWNPISGAAVLFDVARFDSEQGQGPGIAQIDELSRSYDLIIIDTLIAALSGSANENDNALMGAIANSLAQIAHETDTAIVLVHHTGKAENEDVFNTLRGASAIRGAYDVGLLLERKPNEREAVLHAESRDVDVDSMTLRQVPGGVGWEHIGSVHEIEKIRAGRKTLSAMLEHPQHLNGMTVKQIAEYRGTSEATIHKQLLGLEEKGYVYREEQPSTQMGRRPDIWHVIEKYHKR